MPQLSGVGFDIEMTGNTQFTVHGYPSFLEDGVNLEHWFDDVIHTVQNEIELEIDFYRVMAMTYAFNYGIKKGHEMKNREMQDLVDQLFACNDPAFDLKGNKCLSFKLNELKIFKK